MAHYSHQLPDRFVETCEQCQPRRNTQAAQASDAHAENPVKQTVCQALPVEAHDGNHGGAVIGQFGTGHISPWRLPAYRLAFVEPHPETDAIIVLTLDRRTIPHGFVDEFKTGPQSHLATESVLSRRGYAHTGRWSGGMAGKCLFPVTLHYQPESFALDNVTGFFIQIGWLAAQDKALHGTIPYAE